MDILYSATAGTLESSDIMITLEKSEKSSIEIDLKSSVMQQFGNQIVRVISETLQEAGITSANVRAVDKGALDCTIKARVKTAVYRASGSKDYIWKD